jgi:hypothetical protein
VVRDRLSACYQLSSRCQSAAATIKPGGCPPARGEARVIATCEITLPFLSAESKSRNLNTMDLTPALRPRIVMWHSMSCVCKKCLENDYLATKGVSSPLTFVLPPADTTSRPNSSPATLSWPPHGLKEG